LQRFLEIWKDLQLFCEERDIERDQHILGYGEGYSIGVALNSSNITVKEGIVPVSQLFEAYRHFAWEPLQ